MSQDASSQQSREVRYAVVGAGWIAQAVFMPGVAATGNSRLTAIVTGNAHKGQVLAERYGLAREHVYHYDRYDALLGSGLVDAVYIATPNWDHESYVQRALAAGIHVLLEKPVEVSVERAERIHAAAEQASLRGVRLMVAYRLHFEPATLDAIQRVREGQIGRPLFFTSQFSQHVSPQNHRAKHGFDAGPVLDMGPYPINAARNFFGAEPTSVYAIGTRHPEMQLGDFDDTVSVTLGFDGGRVAQFTVSYAGASLGAYQLVGEKGVLQMSPAYTFQAGLTQILKLGGDDPREHTFPAVDQFAGETRYFSDCIIAGRDPEPDSEEGLLDVRVTDAVRRSLETGTVQKLEARARRRRIEPDRQKQDVPARNQPELVEAHAPEQGR